MNSKPIVQYIFKLHSNNQFVLYLYIEQQDLLDIQNLSFPKIPKLEALQKLQQDSVGPILRIMTIHFMHIKILRCN